MKSIALFALLFAVAVPRPVAAEDGKSASKAVRSIRTWFKHWGQALRRSAVESRYRKMRTTSVAAVRGSGQGGEDPARPYWKGTWSEKKEKERIVERKELEAAVELALAGDLEGAGKNLDAFEKAHPKSYLLPDVKQAREQLEALKKETAPPPETAAPAAEEAAPEPAPAEPAPAEPAPAEPAPEASESPEKTEAPAEQPEKSDAPAKEASEKSGGENSAETE
jgi:hypothetical protein